MATNPAQIRTLSRKRAAEDARYRGLMRSRFRLYQISDKREGASGKEARATACLPILTESVPTGSCYVRGPKKGEPKYRERKARITGKEYAAACSQLKESAMLGLNPMYFEVLPDKSVQTHRCSYTVAIGLDVDHVPKGEGLDFLARFAQRVPKWNSSLVHHKKDKDTVQVKWILEEAMSKADIAPLYELVNDQWNRLFPSYPCDGKFNRHVFKNHHYFSDPWHSDAKEYEAELTNHITPFEEWEAAAERIRAEYEAETTGAEETHSAVEMESGKKTQTRSANKGNVGVSRNAYIYERRLKAMAHVLKTTGRMPTQDEIRDIHVALNEETRTNTLNGKKKGPLPQAELESLIRYTEQNITKEKLLSYLNSFGCATEAKILLSFIKAFVHNLVSIKPNDSSSTYLYDETLIKNKFLSKKKSFLKKNSSSSVDPFYQNDSYFLSPSTMSSYCRNETKLSRSTTWRLKTSYADLYTKIPQLKTYAQKCREMFPHEFNELAELIDIIVDHALKIRENTLKTQILSEEEELDMSLFARHDVDWSVSSHKYPHYPGGRSGCA